MKRFSILLVAMTALIASVTEDVKLENSYFNPDVYFTPLNIEKDRFISIGIYNG